MHIYAAQKRYHAAVEIETDFELKSAGVYAILRRLEHSTGHKDEQYTQRCGDKEGDHGSGSGPLVQ